MPDRTQVGLAARWAVAVVLAILSIAPSGLFAQQITGSLTGIVSDPSGAVIPNAGVTLTNDQSGDTRRTRTNSDGYFSIAGVMPGTYTVLVEAQGFANYKVEQLTFSPGDRRALNDIALKVAATGTEVQVVSTVAELTPVESGEKAVVINQQQLQNVPVVGRSASEFIKILPGMTAISNGIANRPGFNGEVIGINGNGDGGKQSAIGNFSANGTRPEALDITADGAHVSDPGCNCANPVNPNVDMIEEFKVQQSNFSAENSKGPVVMSSVTKAGGRDFHGAAYLSARHYSMNSNDAQFNATGAPRPENKFFFPGGNIGGPVLIPGTGFNRNRDKMFFFTGFEYYKQTIDTGLLRSIVPTEAMRRGDFSDAAYMNALNRAGGGNINTPTQILPDGTRVPYPNGQIPASEIDPGMQKLLSLVPLPNTDPAGIGQGFNWVKALEVDQNMWQSLSRVDYSFSDNAKLFVRYNRQNELQPFPVQLWWRNAGAVPLPSPINGKNRSDSISANLTNVLSPSLTNEFVFGYTFVDFPNEYADYDAMKKSTIGYPYKTLFNQDDKIPGFLSWQAPVSGIWMPGGFDPVLFATKHLWTVTDNVSKVAGTHTMKFGGYWGWIRNAQPGNDSSPGLAFFSTWHANTSNNLLADMVRGSLDSWQEYTKAINRDMGWQEFAFYAQDSWKVSRRLTLEYGLRLQHMQPWTARNGIGTATWVQSQYNPNASANDLPGVSWHKRDPNIPLAGWATRALYYAPRAGFAWDVFGTGRTVLRGGFGVFNYHDPQLAAGAMDLPAGLRSTTIGGGPFLRDIQNIAAQGGLVFGGTVVDSTDDRQPRTMNYSFTVSQRLPARMLWEVAYVGSKSDNLVNGDSAQDINRVPLGAMFANPTADANTYRPMKLYQGLNVVSHDFYSNYNSLQTTLAKQTGMVNYTLAYTWSKAMGIVGNIINPFRLEDNYGPLSFDRTHVFTSSYVLNLPSFAKSNLLAKGLVNGWQVSGIVQLQSGVNIVQYTNEGNMWFRSNYLGRSIGSTDVYGTNAITLTPRVICDPRSNLAEGQYINGACFASPIAGDATGRGAVPGNFMMPYMRGPAFFTADLALYKSFRMGERRELQFRFAANNFMNHPVRSFVGDDPNLQLSLDEAGKLTNPRFGYADAKVGRRIVIMTAKFFF